tara:strand:+ start:880 stop:1509 length:630 start_codon:yes stop_codon:yes gene_type:complete
MKDTSTLKKIEKLYTENLNNYGNSSKSVGWNSEECQKLRFEKLTSVIENPNVANSINDYGCGYGEHLKYLKTNNYQIKEYFGYDISRPMLNNAKEHLSDLDCRISLLNSSKIKTLADYSFVSGTFNVKFEQDENSWIDFIKSTLKNIHKFSNKGFAFNLLSTFVDYKESHLYYADPCYWFNYCKKNFSKKVSILHDYPLYEWTMIIKKG